MTRKDYILIANAIKAQADFCKENNEEEGLDAIKCVAQELSERLQEDNPRFSSYTFLKACNAL